MCNLENVKQLVVRYNSLIITTGILFAYKYAEIVFQINFNNTIQVNLEH